MDPWIRAPSGLLSDRSSSRHVLHRLGVKGFSESSTQKEDLMLILRVFRHMVCFQNWVIFCCALVDRSLDRALQPVLQRLLQATKRRSQKSAAGMFIRAFMLWMEESDGTALLQDFLHQSLHQR